MHEFTLNSIDGKPGPFRRTREGCPDSQRASRCGFTPQYAGLEALYEKYKDRGFTILGFPANISVARSRGPMKRSRPFAAASTT